MPSVAKALSVFRVRVLLYGLLVSTAAHAYAQAQATSEPVSAAQSGSAAFSARGPQTGFYEVRPGDTLSVSFRFTPEFNEEVMVQPDGRVNLKATGEIQVAGQSLPQVEQRIVHDSANRLVNPEVTVALKEFERPRFVVAGEVLTPGKFELRQPTTVLQAILLAGGPKEDSAMGHVYLFRRLNATDAEVHVLQLNRYDRRTRQKNDLLLQPNDMILVERDALEKIGRVVKLFNLGVYVNPLPQNGLY